MFIAQETNRNSRKLQGARFSDYQEMAATQERHLHLKQPHLGTRLQWIRPDRKKTSPQLPTSAFRLNLSTLNRNALTPSRIFQEHLNLKILVWGHHIGHT